MLNGHNVGEISEKYVAGRRGGAASRLKKSHSPENDGIGMAMSAWPQNINGP